MLEDWTSLKQVQYLQDVGCSNRQNGWVIGISYLQLAASELTGPYQGFLGACLGAEQWKQG